MQPDAVSVRGIQRDDGGRRNGHEEDSVAHHRGAFDLFGDGVELHHPAQCEVRRVVAIDAGQSTVARGGIGSRVGEPIGAGLRGRGELIEGHTQLVEARLGQGRYGIIGRRDIYRADVRDELPYALPPERMLQHRRLGHSVADRAVQRPLAVAVLEFPREQGRCPGAPTGIRTMARGALRPKQLCTRGQVRGARARNAHHRIRIARGHQAGDLRLAGAGHDEPEQLAEMHIGNPPRELHPHGDEPPADIRDGHRAQHGQPDHADRDPARPHPGTLHPIRLAGQE